MHGLLRFSTVAGLALASAMAFSTATFADETTTTRTTTESGPAPGIVVGVPGVVGVQIGGGQPEGCSTKTTTHTNDETGDSVSHTRTNC